MNPTRVVAAGAMLAWAYFVALWRNDYIRSSQILVVFEQFFQAHLDVFGQGLSAASQHVLGAAVVAGMYDEASRAMLQRALYLANDTVYTPALLSQMPMACPATGNCPTNAGASGASAWGAAVLLPLRDPTAPIWAAWNIANSVAAQDTAPHLQSWAQNFVEGVDTTAAHQAVATPEQTSTPGPAQVPLTTTTFMVPGTVIRRATDPIWYWAVGAVAVTTIGVGLLFFPWHKVKRGSRR